MKRSQAERNSCSFATLRASLSKSTLSKNEFTVSLEFKLEVLYDNKLGGGKLSVGVDVLNHLLTPRANSSKFSFLFIIYSQSL